MKKVLLVIALVAGGLVVKAQNNQDTKNKSEQHSGMEHNKSGMNDPNVPGKAKTELNKKYPEAASSNVKWEKDGQNFEANFTTTKKKEYEVKFDNQGNWVSTKIEKGTKEELPQKVKDAISTGEYKSWEVKDVETKEMPGKTTYMIEVRSGIKTKELTVDKNGTIVKTENKMM